MVTPTLLAGAVFSALAAFVYGYVGFRLSRRRAEGEARRASGLFALWWGCLAVTTGISAVLSLFGAFGIAPFALHLAATQVNIAIVCVGLACLVYYLVYLYTGSSRFLVPLVVFYLAYYATLVYYIASANPIGVKLRRWQTELEYERPFQGPFFLLIVLFLVGPQFLGALAYFLLYFRLDDRTQKFRVALVSGSIIVWFGSALVATAANLGQADWWQLTSRVIGLAAALTILLAYLPPPWIKSRYGITSIADETWSRRSQETGS